VGLVEVVELAPGLWRWTARHPDWTPEQGGPEGWEPEVASYHCESGSDLLLIDPIVPDDGDDRDRFWRALDRDVERVGKPNVVLTCAWHARSTGAVLDRYGGVRLWTFADGVDELPSGVAATDPFRPGDQLPGGAVAIAGLVFDKMADVLVWLPSHSALVAGDTLIGGGPAGIRVCPDSWLGDADPAAARAALRERLEDVAAERVLPTHGEPLLSGARAALDRALA
jgi:glyoxylase-like metal-dependent hydrolase (beta-lactamase superfamily II)